MDSDIQDILASVSAPVVPQRSIDLQALTRAWVQERTSPDLLPYPSGLIDRTMERLKKQIDNIEDMTGTMDPQANFTLVIFQTELERFKFLIRSFLRARISKIDKFAQHYLAQPDNLSPLEREYLHAHSSLLSSHYNTSFLSSFPTQLQKLDDTTGGISMVDKPDEDTAVFCRVLRDVTEPVEVYGESETNYVDLRRGDVWVLRWSAVQEGVTRGDIELI